VQPMIDRVCGGVQYNLKCWLNRKAIRKCKQKKEKNY